MLYHWENKHGFRHFLDSKHRFAERHVSTSGELFASVILDRKLHSKIAGTTYSGFNRLHLRESRVSTRSLRIGDPWIGTSRIIARLSLIIRFIRWNWITDVQNNRDRIKTFSIYLNYLMIFIISHCFLPRSPSRKLC